MEWMHILSSKAALLTQGAALVMHTVTLKCGIRIEYCRGMNFCFNRESWTNLIHQGRKVYRKKTHHKYIIISKLFKAIPVRSIALMPKIKDEAGSIGTNNLLNII